MARRTTGLLDMKNMKIGKKLLVTFGIVGILYIVTVIGIVAGMRIIASNFSAYHNGPMVTSTTSVDLQRGLVELEKNLILLCTTESEVENQQYYNGLQDSITVVEDAISTLSKHIILKENRERLEAIQFALEELEEERD